MTEEELRVLAWTLLGEAAGEGTRGMEAVAHVIRNRSLSGRFPDNPASVALQSNSSGIHQFSTWNAITQGGNIPRARYPVGSASFDNALKIAKRVFGATPGKDPTQGATHYYSPKGMAGGREPYWWKGEAPRGSKQIGGHIFAIKYDEKVAPTPAERTATRDLGSFPSKGQLEVARTGKTAQLPTIGPTGGPSLKKAPVPARQSLALQISRENGEVVPKVTQTLIFDPVTNTLVPRTEIKRPATFAGQEGKRTPAKEVQRVAGFSVPGGTAGIAAIEEMRKPPSVKSVPQSTIERGPPRPKPGTQTQFAQPAAQPAGSINDNKGQERITPAGALAEPKLRVESGGLSRDAVAARAAGVRAGFPRVAPIPQPPIQRPPVAIPASRKPLKIVVDGANPIAPAKPDPASLYYTDPIAFGREAVSQSGDTSVGSQADAAAARASGNSWRESQSSKKGK